MDKQLLNELRTIEKAKQLKDNTISKESIYEINAFMDGGVIERYNSLSEIEPKKPEMEEPIEPEKPIKPELNLINEKAYLKSNNSLDGSDFVPPIWACIAGGAIVLVSLLFLLAGSQTLSGADTSLNPELANEQGNTFLIIFYVMLGAGVGLFLFAYLIKILIRVGQNSSSKRKQLEEIRERNNQRRRYYEDKTKEYETSEANYPEKLAEYNVKKAQYDQLMADYNAKLKEYESSKEKILKEYEAEKEKAEVLKDKHNSEVREKAEQAFEDTLNSLSNYFPRKYIYKLDQLINILEDARADTLKEAIEKLIEDEHRQSIENAQYAQLRSQQEQEERNEEMRREARLQCSSCANHNRCPSSTKHTLTGPCPNYRSPRY